MNPEELSKALQALARRIERLTPLNHDPERYFVERDDIRAELEKLASRLTSREVERVNPRAKYADGDVYVAGRRVSVSKRKASISGRC